MHGNALVELRHAAMQVTGCPLCLICLTTPGWLMTCSLLRRGIRRSAPPPEQWGCGSVGRRGRGPGKRVQEVRGGVVLVWAGGGYCALCLHMLGYPHLGNVDVSADDNVRAGAFFVVDLRQGVQMTRCTAPTAQSETSAALDAGLGSVRAGVQCYGWQQQP